MASRTTIQIPVRRRFGLLTVIGMGETTIRMRKIRGTIAPIQDVKWRCRCECGEIRDVFPTNLKSGRTTSCGHVQAQARRSGPPKLCTVDGCGQIHAAKGLCREHYGIMRYRLSIGDTTPVGQPMKRRRSSGYDADMVASVAHLSLHVAARALGTPRQTLATWRKRYIEEQGK